MGVEPNMKLFNKIIKIKLGLEESNSSLSNFYKR